MNKQYIYKGDTAINELSNLLINENISKILLVCGENCLKLPIVKEITRLSTEFIIFSNFKPNPTYESIITGVDLFNKEECKAIIAIGGGSALDVAKCIKLFSTMNPSTNYLSQTPKDNNVTLITIPTTAGTGSEATQFAVIYYNGEKQTLSHPSIIPQYVLMEPKVLRHLPEYQKKATMMDAFCHGVESFLSVNSTSESKNFSEQALKLLLTNMDGYLLNTNEGNENMLLAANIAGKAINITQTTAGHAMCYKMTSLYGISHGHAAILCLPKLWLYMNSHMNQCSDPRGKEYLQETFISLANILDCHTVELAIKKIENIINNLQLDTPKLLNIKDLDILTKSVNPTRLMNTPISLDEEDLKSIYCNIFSG